MSNLDDKLIRHSEIKTVNGIIFFNGRKTKHKAFITGTDLVIESPAFNFEIFILVAIVFFVSLLFLFLQITLSPTKWEPDFVTFVLVAISFVAGGSIVIMFINRKITVVSNSSIKISEKPILSETIIKSFSEEEIKEIYAEESSAGQNNWGIIMVFKDYKHEISLNSMEEARILELLLKQRFGLKEQALQIAEKIKKTESGVSEILLAGSGSGRCEMPAGECSDYTISRDGGNLFIRFRPLIESFFILLIITVTILICVYFPIIFSLTRTELVQFFIPYLLPPLLISAYLGAVFKFNRKIIKVNGNELTVMNSPLPVSFKRVIKSQSIARIYCKKGAYRPRRGRSAYWLELRILMNNGKDILLHKFASRDTDIEAGDEQKAYEIEAAIEDFLNIDGSVRVLGEYQKN